MMGATCLRTNERGVVLGGYLHSVQLFVPFWTCFGSSRSDIATLSQHLRRTTEQKDPMPFDPHKLLRGLASLALAGLYGSDCGKNKWQSFLIRYHRQQVQDFDRAVGESGPTVERGDSSFSSLGI